VHQPDDDQWMALAITMGRRGLGRTAPNPAVGAVLVQPATGTVVGRGWTQPGGRPHAETEALARAGAAARGATLYVTLEPCSHHGRTPPCADAVIAAGVARVVVGGVDSDLRVAGRGIERLRAAGVVMDRTTAALEEACHRLTLGHILRVTEGRPLVQLKLAVTPGGRLPLGNVRVTGSEAGRFTHLLRAQADAILTGIGTILADDPELTCRLPGMGERSPLRVVLDSAGRLPPASRLVRSSAAVPVLVITALGATTPPGCQHEAVALGPDGRLDLLEVLRRLAARGITRAMVEAGPAVAQGLLAAALIDEAVILHAGTAPDGIATSLAFVDGGLERLTDRYDVVEEHPLGADRVQIFRRR
jgi:diaminohydroxyphosphoribosylaminopyrimidine deaminase / 5-amino-6-(5-phosphoribosylamino)uracil reductase